MGNRMKEAGMKKKIRGEKEEGGRSGWRDGGCVIDNARSEKKYSKAKQ